MNASAALIFLMSSILLASCPLGFPPEDACLSDSPSCALFTDENSDTFCDNPGPSVEESSVPEEESPEDSTAAGETLSPSDSLPDNPEDETTIPVDSFPIEVVPEISIQPEEAVFSETVYSGEESVFVSDRVLILSDVEGHLYCVNPDHDATTEHCSIVWETSEIITDSSTISEEIQISVSDDSVFVDTITIEELNEPLPSCPLNLSPEDACHEETPACTFYTDADTDAFCDNPGVIQDSSSAVSVTGVTYSLVPLASGCPVGLPPEAACPTADNTLCTHYAGLEGCVNPSGGGMRRVLIVLIATAVLLPVATLLKRHFRGRRKKDRRKRKFAHITVQIVSLAVLGFLIQGCFCPLGVIQYALLPGGLIFLGGLGIAVLVLPMLWTMFFDRIYCGWVCPIGALQDLLGKLNVPRPPRFSRKVHGILSGLRYLIALLFFAFIVLVSAGQFANLSPEAFFCKYDPFHTIFSFFMVGSFIGGVATLSFLVFFPRFFCKYLCFYGAILSFFGRVGLWKRFTRKHNRQYPGKTAQKE